MAVTDTIRIETPDDPRVKDYRLTSDPVLARERGLLVAEGRLVVRRLLGEPRFKVRSLLLSDAAANEFERGVQELDPEIQVYICPGDHFRSITGFDIHRGCLALAERPAPLPLETVLAGSRLVVILDSVANPDNIGGVFRNAAAFGADAVLLSPTCADPLYRKAIRTSMGAVLQVPFASIQHWPDGLAGITASGFALIALTPDASAETLETFAAGGAVRRLAVVVGNEGTGLSSVALRMAERKVRIPIRPSVDSLNLAVATGVLLSRLTRLE